MTPSHCPSADTLSAWLDDELSSVESQAIRNHLESCATCREQALGWARMARDFESFNLSEPEHDSPIGGLRAGAARLTIQHEHDSRTRRTTCLDEEVLVSYSDAELSRPEAARAEQHLKTCPRCVAEVQRLIHLRVAMGEPVAGTARQPQAEAWAGASRRGVADAGAWLRAIGRTFARPWPAVGALAATAAVVILVVRFVPLRSDEIQFRGAPGPLKVEVIADNVIARARPSENAPVVATVGRGTVATRLEESGDWTRIELADGRRVWVRTTAVSRLVQAAP